MVDRRNYPAYRADRPARQGEAAGGVVIAVGLIALIAALHFGWFEGRDQGSRYQDDRRDSWSGQRSE